MKKFSGLILILLAVLAASCRKNATSVPDDICLRNSSIIYLKRWSNAFTRTTVYNNDGSVQKTSIISGHGYFQVNLDNTYSLFTDVEPETGKWSIDQSCQFVLNPKTGGERKFSVTKLSNDSLVIRQKVGNTVYVEHYSNFTCPEFPLLQFRWDNVSILESKYDGRAIVENKYTYPVGYFRLNPDATYNVFSNGNILNGTWGILQPGCLVVLDRNKPIERSFEVQKLTRDSLIIWRKDTVRKMNFLQYYKKH